MPVDLRLLFWRDAAYVKIVSGEGIDFNRYIPLILGVLVSVIGFRRIKYTSRRMT